MEEVCEIDRSTLAQLLECIVSKLEDWLIIGDAYGKIIYANETVYRVCGITEENVLGQDMCMFVGIDLSDDEVLNKIQLIIERGEQAEFLSNRFIKHKKRVYLTNRMEPITSTGGTVYYICVSGEVTSSAQLKEELYRINYFDKLTHLPNEKIFVESLSKQIRLAHKKDEEFVLTLIDMKKIGEINNLYGVTVGDYIIKEVSNRIKLQLHVNQEIFKYGDNLFAIIHRNSSQEDVEQNFLKKIQNVMEEPIQVKGMHISVDFRGGAVVFPKDATSSEELVQLAQIALAKAKKHKLHGPYIFYNEDIRQEAESTMQIEKEMQDALQNDEFIVFYQPFVALGTENIVGMEALLRRRKKNGEMMSPATFIEVLEKMNLIGKVGIRVLEMVCEQLRYWMDSDYHVVPVSVNLSALQFKNPNLAKQIKAVLERYDIAPEYIVLEITESAVMEDVISAKFIIDELKAYGFAISIDDFGTGYASIGYLKKFMFDHLKIDISFIREIVGNVQDRSLVEAIISIAKTLNLKTIAEGIENEEQLYIMSALGCEMGQGFFWDRPISAPEIENKYFKICQ